MATTMSVTKQVSFEGKDARSITTSTYDVAEKVEPAAGVPAAKVGQLTTRSSVSAGTLTMTGGHGFVTGDKIDLYWNGGARATVVVGTVATNSVPISGGTGTDLPANLTAITAMVPATYNVAVVGNNLAALLFYSPVSGTMTLLDGSNAVLFAVTAAPPTSGAGLTFGAVYSWTDQDGSTNPLAAVTVAKVHLSHGSTSAQTGVYVQFGTSP